MFRGFDLEQLWNLTIPTTTSVFGDQNCCNPCNGEVHSDKGLLMMVNYCY